MWYGSIRFHCMLNIVCIRYSPARALRSDHVAVEYVNSRISIKKENVPRRNTDSGKLPCCACLSTVLCRTRMSAQARTRGRDAARLHSVSECNATARPLALTSPSTPPEPASASAPAPPDRRPQLLYCHHHHHVQVKRKRKTSLHSWNAHPLLRAGPSAFLAPSQVRPTIGSA